MKKENRTFILSPGPYWHSIAANVINFLSTIDPSKKWEIYIKQTKDTRSQKQNRYLWGVVYKLLQEETGNDPEDLHDYFLGEYFGWESVDVMGSDTLRPKRRSKSLPTSDFFEFVEFIRRRAAENGYFIPDPDPYWREVLEMDKRLA